MQVIQLSCPGCSKKLRLKSELAGKKVKCICGQKILVPGVVGASLPEDDNFGLEAEPVDWRASKLVEEEPSRREAAASVSEAIVEPLTPTKATSQPRPKGSMKLILGSIAGIIVLVGAAVGGYFFLKDRSEKQAVIAKVQEADNEKAELDKAYKFYGSGAYMNAIQVMNGLVAKKPDSIEYRKLRRDLYVADKMYGLAKEEAAFILSNNASDMKNDLVLCKMCMATNDNIIYRHFSRLIGKYKIDEIGRLDIEDIIAHIIGRKKTPGLTLYFELYMGALYSDLMKGDMIDPSGLLQIDEAVQHMMSDEIKITAFTKEIEFMELSKQTFEFKVKFGTFVEQEAAKSELKSIDASIAGKKETIEILKKNVAKYQELKRVAAEAIKKRN